MYFIDTNLHGNEDNEYYPYDLIDPYIRSKKIHKQYYKMEMHEYKKLLKNKSTIKNALISNDIYPVINKKKSYITNDFFKKSIGCGKFRDLRRESVFLIKNQNDFFDYAKFKYNKPDVVHDLYYHLYAHYSQRHAESDNKVAYIEGNI